MTARVPPLLAIWLALALPGWAAEPPDSIAALRAAAEKGDAAKQYELAQRYQYGRGVQKDDAEGLKWLRRAAEGGSASAQHDLGFRYQLGEGVPEDYAEAMRWYRRAAEKQHSGAQYNIGELYFEGRGVPRDCAEAARWFRLAAADEDSRAQYHLGVLSLTGCGVPQDDAEAVKWYRQAAEGWHDDAQRALGVLFHAGRGVPKNAAEATKWFRRSWGRRNAAALFLNGREYASGRRSPGAPKDDVLAYFWFSAALLEGDARAQSYVDEVQRRMSPGQVAEAQQLLAEWKRTSERSLEDWVFLLGTPNPGLDDEAQKRVSDAGPEALPALLAALRSATSGRHIVQLSAAVRQMGPRAAAEAAPALETLLASRPPADWTRPFIASALARIDPKRGKAHVPELERCCLDSKYRSWVRMGCLIALNDVDSQSVATRIALLKDEDADLRSMAATGLRKGSAAEVRRPLEAALRDPVLEVRVRAASSLLLVAPDPPASALPTLLEGLCKGNGFDADLVADTLGDIPREVALTAVETLVASLGGGDPRCRTWAAVALGRVDSSRAVPALDLLRQALASEDDQLRHAAAWTLASMGPRAREARADLEQAASKDPALAFARDALKAPPPSLEGLQLREVRLVGLGKRGGVNVAYLLHESGNLWEVQAGQRLFDGVVERVGSEALEFRGESVTRLKLFEKGEPPPQAFDPKQYNGEPLSIDLDADVTSFAALAAQFSGLNVVFEAGAGGRVRIEARNAPWDGLLERALTTGGFASRLDRGHLRIGRRDQMKKMRPLSSRKWSGGPVSLSFRNADVGDVLRLFTDISGLAVEVHPPAPYEPLTLFVHELPWDAALDLIVASYGWTYRIDGDHIRVEVPDAAH